MSLGVRFDLDVSRRLIEGHAAEWRYPRAAILTRARPRAVKPVGGTMAALP
jgi:hypothetical protein